jgi:SAM-dependent methyltransferase
MGSLFPLRQDIEDVIGKAGSAQGNKTVLDVGMSTSLNIVWCGHLTNIFAWQGCGSGQWYACSGHQRPLTDASSVHRALTMASVYTHIRVVAIDQASQLPEDPPANVDWQRHDVNQGLKAYHGQFDIVHVRCIGSGITSYRALLEEASKCLKPGGLAIFVEGDFDLFDEDQHTIIEPATEGKPSGSYLQKWMQGLSYPPSKPEKSLTLSAAVREAQIRRCALSGSDDSPETLDKGLWQFEIYDPSSCNTASIFTPVTPWPQSKQLCHFTPTCL